MAYLPYDPEQDKQQQAPQEGAEEPKTLGTASAGPIVGGGQATAPAAGSAAAPKPTKSGSFTNLMSYVNANKGNDAAMGQTVRSNVDQQAGQAQQKLGAYKQTAQQAVQQGTVQADDGLVNQLKTDPTKVDKQQFQQKYNAAYGGPQYASQVQGYGEAQEQFAKVGQQAQAAGAGYQGAAQLLGQSFERPGYTRGEKSLDSFILSAGDQGRQSLQDIKSTYGQFGGNFTQAANEVQQGIQQGKATTDATRAGLRQLVDQRDAEYGTYFQQKAAEAAEKTKTEQDRYTALASGDDAALQAAGLDADSMKFLRDQDYGFNKLAQAGQAYNAADLADQSQLDQYQALLGLVGQDDRYDFSKAGGSSAGVVSEQVQAAKDAAAARAAVDAARSGFKGQYADLATGSGGADDLGMSQAEWLWLTSNGIDPRSMVAGSEDVTVGSVAGEKATQYNQLANLLGINGLDANEVVGKNYKLDDARLGTTKNAAGMYTGLVDRSRQKNLERAAERKKMEDLIASGDYQKMADTFGVDRAYLEYAGKDNVAKALSGGGMVNEADVANDYERGGYSNLLGMLGLDGTGKLADTNDEGAAWRFDEETLRRLAGKMGGD